MVAPCRLLLAEDDPVSRMFLTEALATAGHQTTVVATGRDALSAACEQCFDLLLIDLNLPILSGADMLARLRLDASASSRATAALALTAETDPSVHAELRLRGFAQVLCKPLAIDPLLVAIERQLTGAAAPSPIHPADWTEDLDRLPAWDDAIALSAANGNIGIVAALRPLMLQELPRQRATTLRALDAGDVEGARSELHRLRAACGFCGASQLGAAVDRLADALADWPRDTRPRAAFEEASARLLATPAPGR
jgi:CheY-like chemotaxis protein/HPt (histidine-containing phosphotransfer) domain-containing protein